MKLAPTQTHALPKAGHRPEEYEDAAAGPVTRSGAVYAAVADGATESAFAGAWAQALAEAWVEEGAVDVAVRRARAAFNRRVEARTPALAWYAEAKVAEGAHATLLGVAVERDGQYRATAVGDCCLFHLREDGLHRAWPLDAPGAFSNVPALLSSRADATTPDQESTGGRVEPGDRLLLATDALAAYLLGADPTAAVGLDADAVAAFVERARRDGMKNDDVTLVELAFRR
ncbi:MAG: protein phosphatase 2C domain-containing protein [Rhodothermales bacterium]|nr:protein phosphatase 2C domain-containing protein [Rhodothermales bacterium]